MFLKQLSLNDFVCNVIVTAVRDRSLGDARESMSSNSPTLQEFLLRGFQGRNSRIGFENRGDCQDRDILDSFQRRELRCIHQGRGFRDDIQDHRNCGSCRSRDDDPQNRKGYGSYVNYASHRGLLENDIRYGLYNRGGSRNQDIFNDFQYRGKYGRHREWNSARGGGDYKDQYIRGGRDSSDIRKASLLSEPQELCLGQSSLQGCGIQMNSSKELSNRVNRRIVQAAGGSSNRNPAIGSFQCQSEQVPVRLSSHTSSM